MGVIGLLGGWWMGLSWDGIPSCWFDRQNRAVGDCWLSLDGIGCLPPPRPSSIIAQCVLTSRRHGQVEVITGISKT